MPSSDGAPTRADVARAAVCGWCGDLPGWAVARGPGGLTDRVNPLLGPAAGDDFDEVGDRRSQSAGYTRARAFERSYESWTIRYS